MMPVPLATDILVLLLVAAITGYFVYVRRQPHLRLPWARVTRSASGMSALVVLTVRPTRTTPAAVEQPVIVAAEVVEPPSARGSLADAIEGFRFIRSQPMVLGIEIFCHAHEHPDGASRPPCLLAEISG